MDDDRPCFSYNVHCKSLQAVMLSINMHLFQDENPSFIDDTYLENAQNSVLENSQNLLALSDSVSGENSSDQLVTDSRTIRLKTAEEAKKEESRRILEESHISEHLEDSSTKSKKNRRLSLSK